eukprot:gene406-biopygen12001
MDFDPPPPSPQVECARAPAHPPATRATSPPHRGRPQPPPRRANLRQGLPAARIALKVETIQRYRRPANIEVRLRPSEGGEGGQAVEVGAVAGHRERDPLPRGAQLRRREALVAHGVDPRLPPAHRDVHELRAPWAAAQVAELEHVRLPVGVREAQRRELMEQLSTQPPRSGRAGRDHPRPVPPPLDDVNQLRVAHARPLRRRPLRPLLPAEAGDVCRESVVAGSGCLWCKYLHAPSCSRRLFSHRLPTDSSRTFHGPAGVRLWENPAALAARAEGERRRPLPAPEAVLRDVI